MKNNTLLNLCKKKQKTKLFYGTFSVFVDILSSKLVINVKNITKLINNFKLIADCLT